MSTGDWLIMAVMVLSVLLAASQGFFLEVFSLAGVTVGYLLASWEYSVVAGWLTFINPPWAANIAGFLIIFLAVTILAGVLGRICSWAFNKVGLRWMDRLLGAAFGLVRGFLVVTVVVMATAAFAPGASWLDQSQMAPYFLVVGRGASWLAPADVRNRVREGIEVIHRGKQKAEDARPSAAQPPAPEEKRSASGGR